MHPDGVEHQRIHLKFQPRRQRNRSHHANRVFTESDLRITNRPYDSITQVFQTSDVVDDGKGGDVVKEGVYREIAPKGVFFGCAKRVVAVNQVIQRVRNAVARRRSSLRRGVLTLFSWRHLPAECRYLDDLLAEFDVRKTKAAADDPAVPKQLLDLVGMGGRADVEVFGSPPDEQVANTSADQVRRVVGLAESIEHFERVRVDVAARERVRGARNDPRFSHWTALYQTRNLRPISYSTS